MKKIAIAVLLSAVVVPAVADEMHMYAGARVGQARTSIDNATLDTSNPTAFGVFIGHIFSPNFAIEGEYLVLGEIKGGGANGGSAKSTGFSLSGVGSFPINEQFSLFGKLGYAMITSKISDTGFSVDAKSNAVTYGLGGQFNVTPAVGVRLGWDQYKLDHTDANSDFKGHVNLVSVGAVFKF